MPTYQYACSDCGHDLEVFQSFTDDALTECPVCHGRLRKVFNSVGIVFKGSGFYRTDSREKSPSGGSKDGATRERAGKESAGTSTSKDSSSKAESATSGGTKSGSSASSASSTTGSAA